MNTTTINISLPIKMYNDAKNFLASHGYASISELLRDELRETLYPKLTENGFTPEFEEMVLEAAKEPVKNDIVFKTDKDIDNYFKHLKTRIKKGKTNVKTAAKR